MTVRRPITFLVHSLTAAGAEYKTITLANGFVARGRAVDICVAMSAAPQLLAAIDPRVRTICFEKDRVRYSAARLVSYLRRRRPAVLVCMMRHTAVMAVLARVLAGRRVPLVFVEGTFVKGTVKRASPFAYWRVAQELRLLQRTAAAIIVNTPALADEFVQRAGLDRSKVAIIPNPAAAAVFADTDVPPNNLAGWPSTGDPVIVTVCRLDANKDVATLIRAFAHVRTTRPLSLAVIGAGPERSALELLAQTLGCAAHVHFMGVVEKPWRYVRKASVFVLASHYETFSNALIEAMAVGCPVVATDARGSTRFILDDGRCGPLTPPGDVPALAAAIVSVLDRPTSAEVLVARARQFSENQIDAYLTVVEHAER